MHVDKLLTTTNVEDFINNPPSFDVAVGMLRNPKVQADLLNVVAKSSMSEMIRVNVLENPNADEEALVHLTKTCVLVWPRVIKAFRRMHPARAGAFNTKNRYSNEFLDLSSETEIAHYFLDSGQALIFDLWHDLSNQGLLRLLWAPNRNDDFFGPFGIDGMEEADFGSPLVQVFGRDDTSITDEYEGWISEELLWEPEDWLNVIKYEQSDQIDYLNEIRQDTQAYEDALFSIMYQQYEYRLKYEAVPVAVPPQLGKVRYFDLDNESQKNFASLVTRGQEHYLIESLGIAEHLAKLLLMHPTTTHLAREVLISSNIPNLARFSKPSGG